MQRPDQAPTNSTLLNPAAAAAACLLLLPWGPGTPGSLPSRHRKGNSPLAPARRACDGTGAQDTSFYADPKRDAIRKEALEAEYGKIIFSEDGKKIITTRSRVVKTS